jgi:hypothetical protein
MTNIYEALSGDYGAQVPVLISEREIARAQTAQRAMKPQCYWCGIAGDECD